MGGRRRNVWSRRIRFTVLGPISRGSREPPGCECSPIVDSRWLSARPIRQPLQASTAVHDDGGRPRRTSGRLVVDTSARWCQVTTPATCVKTRRPSFWARTARRRRWASVRRSGRPPSALGGLDQIFLVTALPAGDGDDEDLQRIGHPCRLPVKRALRSTCHTVRCWCFRRSTCPLSLLGSHTDHDENRVVLLVAALDWRHRPSRSDWKCTHLRLGRRTGPIARRGRVARGAAAQARHIIDRRAIVEFPTLNTVPPLG